MWKRFDIWTYFWFLVLFVEFVLVKESFGQQSPTSLKKAYCQYLKNKSVYKEYQLDTRCSSIVTIVNGQLCLRESRDRDNVIDLTCKETSELFQTPSLFDFWSMSISTLKMSYCNSLKSRNIYKLLKLDKNCRTKVKQYGNFMCVTQPKNSDNPIELSCKEPFEFMPPQTNTRSSTTSTTTQSSATSTTAQSSTTSTTTWSSSTSTTAQSSTTNPTYDVSITDSNLTKEKVRVLENFADLAEKIVNLLPIIAKGISEESFCQNPDLEFASTCGQLVSKCQKYFQQKSISIVNCTKGILNDIRHQCDAQNSDMKNLIQSIKTKRQEILLINNLLGEIIQNKEVDETKNISKMIELHEEEVLNLQKILNDVNDLVVNKTIKKVVEVDHFDLERFTLLDYVVSLLKKNLQCIPFYVDNLNYAENASGTNSNLKALNAVDEDDLKALEVLMECDLKHINVEEIVSKSLNLSKQNLVDFILKFYRANGDKENLESESENFIFTSFGL